MKKFMYTFIFIFSIILFGSCTFFNMSSDEYTIIHIDDIGKIPGVIKKEDKRYIEVNNSKFYNNKYFYGYLSIDNSSFKEPLYQYSDNDYFLTHNSNLKKKSSGATYLDYRVSLNTRKIIIYGHNNNRLSLPFSYLENYNDEEFYKEHKYLYLEKDNNIYKYEIFSIYVETSDWIYTKLKFSDSEYLKHLKLLKSRSIYDSDVELSSDKRALILQTCSKDKKYSKYKNKYLLIIAIEV